MSTKIPGIPLITGNLSAELKQHLEALTEAVEIRLGRRGDPLDRAITLRELVDSGLAKELDSTPFDPNNISADSLGFGSETASGDVGTPTAPTGVSVAGAYAQVIMDWAYPTYTGHSQTEIWSHTSDSIGDATLAGISTGRTHIDPIGGGETRYYWFRHVNTNNVPGPYNSSSGTIGVTATNPAEILAQLTGAISASQLTSSLADTIDGAGSTVDISNLESFVGFISGYSGSSLLSRVSGVETSNASLLTTFGSTSSAATSAAAAQVSAAEAVAAKADAILAQGSSEAAEDASVAAKVAALAAQNAAELAKSGAETAESSAEALKTSAETAKAGAETAQNASSASATSATGSAANAAQRATTAANSANAAGESATAASTSESNASSSANSAGTFAGASETAKTAAESAQAGAETAETNAAASATTAAGSASSAESFKQTAADAANDAGDSATAAASSSQSASAFATDAETASTSAASSGVSASSASLLALGYKNDAETAKGAAETAKGQADAAANAASTSAQTATTNSTAALESANAANDYKTAAETAKADALVYKNDAATSETNAEASMGAAGISAGLASTSENAAGQSATAASNSATAAASYASDALTQAEFAEAHKNSAETAKSTAEQYKETALTASTNAEGHATSAANTVNGLTARLDNAGGTGVTVEQEFSAVADSITGLEGQYSVKIDNNGHVSGFGFNNVAGDGVPESAFVIRADKFALVDPSDQALADDYNPPADLIPFGVTDGKVYIKEGYIEDGTITTAKIGFAAIDDSKIGTLSANTITTGTLSASRLDLDNASITATGNTIKIKDLGVQTGHISNLAVDTIKIAGQAVTIPSSTYQSGSQSFSSTYSYVTLGTITFTSSGNPVFINASAYFRNFASNQGASYYFALYRGSSKLVEHNLQIGAVDISTNSGTNGSISYLDTSTSTGSRTYTIKAKKQSGNGTIYAQARSVTALEVKK